MTLDTPVLENHDLYGGLGGVTLECDYFELGQGVTISATYAHLMAPFLVAFKRPEEGQPHPAPWKAAQGGFAFDIVGELYIPLHFQPPEWFDRLNTIWWIAALMRLHLSPLLRVPAVANQSFSGMLQSQQECHIWPVEAQPRQLVPEPSPERVITQHGLKWVQSHWLSGANLMAQHDNFNIAFQAFDQCVFVSSSSLALIQLWGALEQLFSTSRNQKAFQLASRISAYLEQEQMLREGLYDRITELYREKRSPAAHGTPVREAEPLWETYALTKRVLTKTIQSNHVPTRSEIEALTWHR